MNEEEKKEQKTRETDLSCDIKTRDLISDAMNKFTTFARDEIADLFFWTTMQVALGEKKLHLEAGDGYFTIQVWDDKDEL